MNGEGAGGKTMVEHTLEMVEMITTNPSLNVGRCIDLCTLSGIIT